MRYTVANVTGLELGAASVTGIDTTDETRLTAEKIALATGLWTSKLISSAEGALGIAKQGRIERQAFAAGVAVAHYKMFPAEMEQFSEMPVVVNGGRGWTHSATKGQSPAEVHQCQYLDEPQIQAI